MKIIKYTKEYYKQFNKLAKACFDESCYRRVGYNQIYNDIKGPESEVCFLGVNGNGEIIGFIEIGIEEKLYGKNYGIVGMGILPEYRRKGLGKKLIKKAEAWAKDKKIEKLYLIFPVSCNDLRDLFFNQDYLPDFLRFDISIDGKYIPKKTTKEIKELRKDKKIDWFVPWYVCVKKLT
ncbi:MAG: GNAT family N-acetyltransferase [Candidatus Diapherotrites archaeon]|nr:GNAT family N-acetyltransferase [Candidatus Diapherotrites archaeon]